MTEPLIRPAGPGEQRTALRLSLAAPPQPAFELEKQVNGFIEYTRALNLPYDRQFLAETGGRPVAGCTCIRWPGRTGMVMLGPGMTPALEKTLVDLLNKTVRSACSDGIRLFQSLLLPEDIALPAVFEAAGFKDLAMLHYLERPIESADAIRPPPPRTFDAGDLGVEVFDEGRLEDWRSLILASYDGSLDCPSLAGMRHIDDILAGHRGAGFFSAGRWLLLRYRGRPAGVVMLNGNPLRSAQEIVYTCVNPALRGRGLGQYLVQYGLFAAAAEGVAAVTLAVDERNHPALAIYEAAGFEFTGARRAMIRPAADPTS